MRITTAWLDSRKSPRHHPEKAYDVSVDGRRGMVVRLEASGTISFRMRYTIPGGTKRRWLVFGEYGPGGISLADAYDLHHQAMRELAKSLDPAEEREQRKAAAARERAERVNADTIASIVDQFVHRKLRAERWDERTQAWIRDPKTRIRARKRPEQADWALRKYVVEAKLDGRTVGELKAHELTRRQVVRLLDAIVDAGAPIMANRVYALLKMMFEWAAGRDLIAASPMAGVDKPGGQEVPRDRVLTEDEIRNVWHKMDDAAWMAKATKLGLRLLLATGQRRGELTAAEWMDFDLKGKQPTWTIPPDRQKSAHARREAPAPHVVPLSPLALALAREIHALTGHKGRYVLGGKRPYSPSVLSRAISRAQAHFAIPHFTTHDLRRTAASHMTRLGIPRLHVEKVLNHATGDIAEVYDRHDYLPEKRTALTLWGEALTKITRRDAKDLMYDGVEA